MFNRRDMLKASALGAASLAAPLAHASNPALISGANKETGADRSKSARNVDYLSSRSGAESQSVAGKLEGIVSVKDFGAIGDGLYHPISEWFTLGSAAYRGYNNLAEVRVDYPHVFSENQSIDWAAIQAALDSARVSPCTIELHDLLFIISDTLIWKGGAFLVGVPGRCVIKLMKSANCTIIESYNFDHWVKWDGGANSDYPLDGGIDGVILDGNGGEQGEVSTSVNDLLYGMRIHSHRFGIGWLQVRRVKGVGVLTRCNLALMYSFRKYEVDGNGMQGSQLGMPAPYEFRQISVIDTLYEAFVFEGPADIPVWNLTTNYCGSLERTSKQGGPKTSLLYPGEEVHSVRVQTACKIGYLNSNGAIYGRSLYVAPFTRFHGDSIIVSASWGGVLVEGSSFGSISALCIQHNSFSWGGVYKPGLEITRGTGSATNKNRFSFPQVSLRRLTTPVDRNSIGPGILDNSGAQFGIIDGIDTSPISGHGLVIGAANRGGVYESVNFDSIQGAAHDGAISAAVVVESGARDWRIGQLRLTNCSRGILNFGVNMRGIVRDGVIEVNQGDAKGQIALEGVVSDSQLGAVVVGVGNISVDNIGSWGLEILNGNSRYYNRFKTTVSFDGGVSGAQAGPVVPHSLWRKPELRDIKQGLYWGGKTWPSISAGVHSLSESSVSAAAFVYDVSPGTLTLVIELG